MSEVAAFGSEYFQTVYRDYVRQNPPWKMAFYCRTLEKYGPKVARPRILDIGCAFGKFLSSLDSPWVTFGVDVSEHAIRAARATHPPTAFIVGSALEIPLKGPFHAVTAFDVLEHLREPEVVARYVSSELAPDGIFLFVVPVYDGPLGGIVHRLDRDPTHLYKESRAFWISWAERWFVIQQWLGIFRYLLPLGPYVHWPSKIFREIAPAIMVIARPRRGPHTA
jgi:SAM-dependent methyltransferase